MCEVCVNKGIECERQEKRFRLSEFFDANWEKYISEDDVQVTLPQFKAVCAIRACRTATLGVDYYVCTECGEQKEIYHNCRNRFCPTCSWGDTIKWASKIEGQMMKVPHRHVVFTLPHALIPLIKSNGKELLNIFLRTSADTFKDWVEHKYNVKVGVIAVLHTFGETKEYHPHVHMIVSWGGIDIVTKGLRTIKGEYVNYGFLQNKFRNKFTDELVGLYNSEKLQHKFEDKLSLLRFLKQINKTNWSIHIEPPMPAPSAVIRYIGRYSKRACLSEHKITGIEGEYISFRHKDYKVIGPDNKPVERILRLHYREFFPRLLQHVPLAYFRLVRYYGVYSTKSCMPKEYLNTASEVKEEEWEWENPFVCNICKKPREYMYTIIDIRSRKERTDKFNHELHPYYKFKRA
jgi:hypothetical protein